MMEPSVADGVRLAPPAAYAGAYVADMSLPTIVTILTGLYIILQLGLLVPKYWQLYKEARSKWQSKSKSSPCA